MEQGQSQERSRRIGKRRQKMTLSWVPWKPKTQILPGLSLTETESKNDKCYIWRPSQHVIGVFVHESEVLEMDFLVSHPVVKVYIMYIVHLFLNVTNNSERPVNALAKKHELLTHSQVEIKRC